MQRHGLETRSASRPARTERGAPPSVLRATRVAVPEGCGHSHERQRRRVLESLLLLPAGGASEQRHA
jgi:hypothetical protein